MNLIKQTLAKVIPLSLRSKVKSSGAEIYYDYFFKKETPVKIEANYLKGLMWSYPDLKKIGGKAGVNFVQQFSSMEKGTYELKIQKCMSDIVEEGDVCYDIGSNVGYFSLLMANKTGKAGKVEAFEPMDINLEISKNLISINKLPNVSFHKKLIMEEKKTVQFLVHQNSFVAQELEMGPIYSEIKRYVEEFDKYISLGDKQKFIDLALTGDIDLLASKLVELRDLNQKEYLENKKRIDFIIHNFIMEKERYSFKIEEYEGVPLDELVSENIIKKPNFVKIDVEGAELSVLKGMRMIISENRPKILVDLHYKEAKQEVKDFFNEYNYSFEEIERDTILCLPH